MSALSLDPVAKKTRSAFLWTSLLKTPFWTLYTLLGFILYKDLHATSLQIAAFLALKPVVSIVSIYWSSFVKGRRDRLKSNIIVGAILGYLPFFFFPFVNSPWFFIISAALYMMLTRGIVPAWMEILKLNIKDSSREKVFAYGNAVSYVGAILLPVFLGDMLDIHPGIWRWLFPSCSLLGLVSIFFQLRISIPKGKVIECNERFSLRATLIAPWKNGWKLCAQRKDFSAFQIGFFLGGMGLMIMQPALPKFFFDSLHLSYTELAIALSACKGIGFATTTKYWSWLMQRCNIFAFSSYVTALAALFPLILLLSGFHTFWLYASYLMYGIMQAGSELSWHLSGPIFAKKQDSSIFSSVNVATVGIRGCIGPFLGSLLCSHFSAQFVLVSCFALCLLATIQMGYAARQKVVKAAS
jgi:predicted MFS family arabinose efflux permease